MTVNTDKLAAGLILFFAGLIMISLVILSNTGFGVHVADWNKARMLILLVLGCVLLAFGVLFINRSFQGGEE